MFAWQVVELGAAGREEEPAARRAQWRAAHVMAATRIRALRPLSSGEMGWACLHGKWESMVVEQMAELRTWWQRAQRCDLVCL